ncbi:hypothetical protein Patl1_12854 [Pistacia atlantica]|uniref:Uncharacterized protein n=1 Tax=Pistacia atlantica TaxID=434234 RepID=A0ACC1AYE3_9ROSI|nr:hypothetical protein Patl1_12854 [Pistacia atlantica]
MDKETDLLSRLAANHLHLAQFEPFRATLLALRTRNPDLALAILQTIVANSGRFGNVLWSVTCPSPSLLTYLSTLELLQFNDSTSSTWSFDPEALRLRSEFLLLVQMLIDCVLKRTRKDIDLDSFEKEKEKDFDVLNENDSFDEKVKLFARNEDLGYVNSEFGGCVRVLDRFMELGVKSLKPDVNVNVNDDVSSSGVNVLIEEDEFMCLKKVILEYADVFDALCWNIEKQLRGWESLDSDCAIVRREDLSEEEDRRILGLIQKSAQLAHLDAMKECVKEGDEEGAVSHIRFLHLDYGVEEAEYRMVLEDLLKRVLSKREEFGDTRHAMKEKLLLIYREALSSNCRHLVQLIQVIVLLEGSAQAHLRKSPNGHLAGLVQILLVILVSHGHGVLHVIQDELLFQEIEIYEAHDNNRIPPPLERFQRYILELKPDIDSNDKSSLLNIAVSFCMRDMYHYARVSGLHVLDCIMNTALSAVRREQLQEANNILMLFPRLRPLVAAMGWDLLSGKTMERRKLLQLLWTSKSQMYRLEESSLYGNESDEISCVEHLCGSLCYQLDLASFVAHVNSGQSWNSKFSLLLSGKEQTTFGSEDAQLDPFVENFVLERLSAQSPLRVLFDVVPDIKFQDAIELISLQPIASDVAAWKRCVCK